jgi:hypothetical protein
VCSKALITQDTLHVVATAAPDRQWLATVAARRVAALQGRELEYFIFFYFIFFYFFLLPRAASPLYKAAS